MPSVPFYDFPSSPLLIIGALGIVVALAVFFLAYQKSVSYTHLTLPTSDLV